MVISDKLLKCVAYVGLQMADGSFMPCGTVFFFSPKKPIGYFVTAKHVIDAIKSKGVEKVWIRYNSTDGNLKYGSVEFDQWRYHKTDSSVDVAVFNASPAEDWDHLVWPDYLCATPEVQKENEVSLGDEVLVVGLFRHRQGNKSNIPIARVGNLASTNAERINVKIFGEMEAALIECRSIGGLSGSPVFLNLGNVRVINGELRHSLDGGPMTYLYGIIHGHYDEPGQSSNNISVNSGIAIVTPYRKILEVIECV